MLYRVMVKRDGSVAGYFEDREEAQKQAECLEHAGEKVSLDWRDERFCWHATPQVSQCPN